MSKTVIIDTDILIDVAGGNTEAIAFLEEIKNRHVPSLTVTGD